MRRLLIFVFLLIPFLSICQKIDSLLSGHFSFTETKAPPYFEYVEDVLDTARIYHYYDHEKNVRMIKLVSFYHSHIYWILTFAIGDYNNIDYGYEYLNHRIVISFEKNQGYVIIFEKDFDCSFILDMIKNGITDLFITDTNKRVIYSSGWFDRDKEEGRDGRLFYDNCAIWTLIKTADYSYPLVQIDNNKNFLRIMEILNGESSKKLYYKPVINNWQMLNMLTANVKYDSVKLFKNKTGFDAFFIIYFQNGKIAKQEYKKVILNEYLSECNGCALIVKSGIIIMMLENKIYVIGASLLDNKKRKRVLNHLRKHNIQGRVDFGIFIYINDDMGFREPIRYCPVPISKYIKSE